MKVFTIFVFLSCFVKKCNLVIENIYSDAMFAQSYRIVYCGMMAKLEI